MDGRMGPCEHQSGDRGGSGGSTRLRVFHDCGGQDPAFGRPLDKHLACRRAVPFAVREHDNVPGHLS
jgi:hypothetical protein